MSDIIPNEVRHMIEIDVNSFLLGAKIIEIENEFQRNNSLELCKEIKYMIEIIDHKRDYLVRPLNENVKIINDYFKLPLSELKDMERNIKDRIIEYEKKREMEAKRLNEIARIEKEKIEAEIRRKIEEKEELWQQCEKNIDSGNKKEAEEIAISAEGLENFVSMKIYELDQIMPKKIHYDKLKGTTKSYRAEIEDYKQFLQWVIDTNNFHFISVEKIKLNKAMPMNIPGIRCIEEIGIRVRK